MLLEEEQVVLAGHLVADDGDRDAELGGVVAVLAVDGDALEGRFDDQERHVEAGEQAGGEGVGAGGHVDDDVLTGAVDEVVQVQLDRTELGVVAGHVQVAPTEGAGHHERYAVDLLAVARVDLVVAEQAQQAGATSGRRRLDHGLGGRDPGVRPAQVVPDLVGACAERRCGERLVLVEAEGGGQVLVDVTVDREDRRTRACRRLNEEVSCPGWAVRGMSLGRTG